MDGGVRMRRSIVAAALAGLALAATVVATAAQEPSPPPWFGGRVELPEDGIAVTMPEGWIAIDLAGDMEAQARALLAELDPDASPETIAAITGTWQGAQQQGLRLGFVSSAGFCGVGVQRVRDIDLDATASALYMQLSNPEMGTSAQPPEPLVLAAGPARRVLYAFSDGDEAAIYVGSGRRGVFLVSCVGGERPEDGWRSVAEALEFLPPAEET